MKPKIGDTVQFKKSGIIGTVEKILRGACIVDTHGSKLSAWPEDLIICGLSEVSLDKEMDEHQKIVDEIMAIQGIEPIEAEIEEVWYCPESYIFKDENGNVINATKIVLEKKKKAYPKTFEKCCKILGLLNVDLCFNADYRSFDASKEQWKRLGLMNQFYQLLICRDAYWKIAGEEMGLRKPWKPDWENDEIVKYCIIVDSGIISKQIFHNYQFILAFPTEEMRDAFCDNFKSEIEQCKELL